MSTIIDAPDTATHGRPPGGQRPTGSLAWTIGSVVLAILGLVVLVAAHRMNDGLLLVFAPVAIGVPLILAASRARAGRRGCLEYGLLRDPLRRDLRAHMVQALNVWLCCGLLGAAITAGSVESGRLVFSPAVFDALEVAIWIGLVALAALALVPRRQVTVATNLLVLVLSGFLVAQLARISTSPTDAVVLDSPLRGEWLVASGGRSALINSHYIAVPRERHAIDFVRLGRNGQTHTGSSLASYPGYGAALYAPAAGRVVELDDDFPDEPEKQTTSDANDLVLDIGGGRYVVMAHLQRGSARVGVGDRVRRGQLLARVGNSGTQGVAPHLHMHVQNRPYDHEGGHAKLFTYPMAFRRAHITRGGSWPRSDVRELRRGDRIRPI